MNVGSGAQVQQLLFAGAENREKDKKDPLPLERVFKVCVCVGGVGVGAVVRWQRVLVAGC